MVDDGRWQYCGEFQAVPECSIHPITVVQCNPDYRNYRSILKHPIITRGVLDRPPVDRPFHHLFMVNLKPSPRTDAEAKRHNFVWAWYGGIPNSCFADR